MTDSWWLKVKRAQQHMVDIRAEARRYAESHPYRFTMLREPEGDRRQVRWRVYISAEPDPRISLMLGDFIHNLRSALDHVFVACVPKKERNDSTAFPMIYDDPFARDEDDNFVFKDVRARDNFQRAIAPLHPAVRAFIVQLQPYHLGDLADTWTLGIINRLDNADKHHGLIGLRGGIIRPVAHLPDGDSWEISGIKPNAFMKKGTIIGWGEGSLPKGAILPTKVDMQLTGTAAIYLKVTSLRGGKEQPFDMPLTRFMLGATLSVRKALRALELAVIR